MFWIALAAQMSAPGRINYLNWFSTDDMPNYVQTFTSMNVVVVRATVRPDGNLKNCEVETSSGDKKLDAITCGVIRNRARYSPARWIDGTPSYGVDRLVVTWLVSMTPGRWREADLNLTVNRLPKGVHTPAYVPIIFAVDQNGRQLRCEPASSLSTSESSSELAQIACAEWAKSYAAIPARDESGKPVRSVQTAMVRFAKKH